MTNTFKGQEYSYLGIAIDDALTQAFDVLWESRLHGDSQHMSDYSVALEAFRQGGLFAERRLMPNNNLLGLLGDKK